MTDTFPTLTLTSPLTKGPKVSEAQYLLKANRHDKKFYEGKIDGAYGVETAAASKEAKWTLGFPSSKIDSDFGFFLRSLLVPGTHPDFAPLPFLYKTRMRARLAAQQSAEGKRKAVLAFAKSFTGYREIPQNKTMFGKWYGLDGYPWCAMFVSYCLSKNGFPFHKAYVPFILADARQGRDKTFVTRDPLPGHMVCFDWDPDGTYDHIGFFSHWVDRDKGIFATCEGNTLPPGGSGDQSNGGGVYQRQRSTQDTRVSFVGWRP